MNDDVFISYIVPCYNVQNYLPKCLESLSKQKIDAPETIEYILVNDGSQDDTLRLLEDFVNTDARATLINQQNQGVSAARNNGLQKATGKYVFFLDGDDYLTDEASQLVYDIALKKEVDIIIPCAFSVKESDLQTKKEWNTFVGMSAGIYQVQQFVNMAKDLPISVKVYKRDTLIRNNVFFDTDLKVGEVYTFFFHALAFSQYISLTNEHIFNWVIRNEGTTKGYNVNRDKEIVNTIHRINEYSNLFKYCITSLETYNISLFKIANTFSVIKYPPKYKLTQEIELFFQSIISDEVYNDVLKFFIFRKPKCNKRFFVSTILFSFPVKVSYFILRIKSIVMSLLS